MGPDMPEEEKSKIKKAQIDFSIHYNKFSLRDPILHGVIDVIRNAF